MGNRHPGWMVSVIEDLESTLRDRRAVRPDGSYTAGLFNEPERIQRKVMEEAFETCLEFGRHHRDPSRVAAEAADLLFHVLVGLVDTDVPFSAVLAELEQRRR